MSGICTRCNNVHGIYYWGPRNSDGEHLFSGRCFRCKGTGIEPSNSPTKARAGLHTAYEHLTRIMETKSLTDAHSLAHNMAAHKHQPKTAEQALKWMADHPLPEQTTKRPRRPKAAPKVEVEVAYFEDTAAMYAREAEMDLAL